MTLPRIGLTLGLGFALGLGLAACNDNDDGTDASITAVATREIRDNTSETSEPIVINDLDLSGRDTEDTTLPTAI